MSYNDIIEIQLSSLWQRAVTKNSYNQNKKNI